MNTYFPHTLTFLGDGNRTRTCMSDDASTRCDVETSDSELTSGSDVPVEEDLYAHTHTHERTRVHTHTHTMLVAGLTAPCVDISLHQPAI